MIYNLNDLPIFHGRDDLTSMDDFTMGIITYRSSTLSWMIILNHLNEIIINKNHLKSLYINHIHQNIHQQTSSIIWMLSGWWFQPLWKIWKSVGMMTFPAEWNNKIHVPNHQPVYSSNKHHLQSHGRYSYHQSSSIIWMLNQSVEESSKPPISYL